MKEIDVYGIGSPLMDMLVDIKDEELEELGLNKGIMHLLDDAKRNKVVSLVDTREKAMACGGDCPNTMIALAGLGCKTALFGKVGDDHHGEFYSKKLDEHNVINHLGFSGNPTGSAVILVSPDSERTMSTHLGCSIEIEEDEIDPDMIGKSSYLYVTGYFWNTEAQKTAMLKAMRSAVSQGTQVVFDVADPFVVKENRQDFLRIIEDYASIVFANKEEAKLLYECDAEDAAARLGNICNTAVVKLGSEGAVISSNGEMMHVPANLVDALDTTGAGDMFAAGFLYGLCRDMSHKDAGVFASYLASNIVTQKGAQFSTDKLEEIRDHVGKGTWNYII